MSQKVLFSFSERDAFSSFIGEIQITVILLRIIFSRTKSVECQSSISFPTFSIFSRYYISSVTTEEARIWRIVFSFDISQLFSCMKSMELDGYSVYRICAVTMPFLFEVADYESKWASGKIHDEFPRLEGPFSFITDSILTDISKNFKGNFSLNLEKEAGSKKKDGTLIGCYRSIRDNESDISIVPVDYPTIDYDKVDPYQILMESPLKIMSGYRSETKAKVSFNDFILTSIQSFDRQTWFAVLAMVLAFAGLWMTKRALFPNNEDVSMRRTIFETLWDTFLLFISQQSTVYSRFVDRFLSILMTLSFFFLTKVYFGLMSTDLVSVTKPSVINSYQDIMNRPNVTPVFLAVLSDVQEFENAYEDDDGSIQAKFWAKYKDTAEMAHPYGDPTKMAEMMQKAVDLKRVLIINGLAMEATRRTMCKFKVGYRVFPSVYSWVARDPDARMRKKGLIMRNGMKQTPQVKTLRRKVRRAFETGIIHGALSTISMDGVQSVGQFASPSAPYSQVEKCLSDQVVYAHASVDTVVPKNFRHLLTLSVLMLSVSIKVLLIELFRHRNH